MSVESWLAEFLPVPVNEIAEEDALEASILKWTGLLPENLEKHNCSFTRKILRDTECSGTDGLVITDTDTCALCEHYFLSGCEGCPLEESGQGCLGSGSPYSRVAFGANPKTMLRALKDIQVA